MITAQCKKRGQACSCMLRVIVSKLGKRQKAGPVVLAVGGIAAKILLENLVETLSLTVGLAMVTRGQRHIGTKKLEQAGPEFGNELRTTIANDLIGNTIKSDNRK